MLLDSLKAKNIQSAGDTVLLKSRGGIEYLKYASFNSSTLIPNSPNLSCSFFQATHLSHEE